jgi:hypothetical protein
VAIDQTPSPAFLELFLELCFTLHLLARTSFFHFDLCKKHRFDADKHQRFVLYVD